MTCREDRSHHQTERGTSEFKGQGGLIVNKIFGGKTQQQAGNGTDHRQDSQQDTPGASIPSTGRANSELFEGVVATLDDCPDRVQACQLKDLEHQRVAVDHDHSAAMFLDGLPEADDQRHHRTAHVFQLGEVDQQDRRAGLLKLGQRIGPDLFDFGPLDVVQCGQQSDDGASVVRFKPIRSFARRHNSLRR